jgi:KipI family sensor histidine kinase inhibitor
VSTFRIVPAGDTVLTVEFAERIDPVINATAIALAAAIESAAVRGVRDVVPTYRTVAVYFDPLRTNLDDLRARLEQASAAVLVEDGLPSSVQSRSAVGDPVRVPVCYAREFGPDLAEVAAFAAISEAEAIRLHTARTYRVFMLGFTPGFAYMGTVDERIAAPRLSTPRIRVPAGSVGIAGAQTGIYPSASPGGWRIVGRTPLRPFDLSRHEPVLFKPGDAVQFYAIDPGEYDRLQSAR